MELVYLWVEEYKNIKKQGFNFSPNFKCEFKDEYDEKNELKDKCELIIIPKENPLKDFFGRDINITTIIGENGSGKSSIIQNIFEFLDSELVEKNTIIIYYENNQYTCITDIVDINTSSIKNITTVQNNQQNISKKLIVYNHTYEHRYHIFRSYRTMEIDKLSLINLLVFNYDQSIDFHLTNFMYQPNKINIKYKDEESIISLIERMSSSTKELVEFYKKQDSFRKFLITLCARDGIDNLKFYKSEIDMISRLNLNREELVSLHSDFITMNNEFPFTLENKEKIEKYIGREYFNLFEFDLFDEKGRSYNNLSHGEQVLFGLLLNIFFYSRNESSIFLLDEPELSLHPQWQKGLLNEIITLLKKFTENKYQLIITSHSPFLLSDLAKENVIFLEKGKQVYPFNENQQTFGANIHTLLSHGFFMKDGLMGEFAKDKIKSIINYQEGILKKELTKDKNKKQRDEEQEKYEKEYKTKFWQIQSIIGDDYLKQVVKNHLIEIEKAVLGNNEAKEEEIKRLEVQIKQLRK